MQSTFPILRFTTEAMALWSAEEKLSMYNGEFPQQLERNGRAYNLGKDTKTHVEYYPALSPAEQLIDAEEFFQELCGIMQGKGFDVGGDITVSPNTKVDGRSFNATVYYGLADDRIYLYTQGCFYYNDLTYMYQCRKTKRQFAHNVKTAKEMRLGKMLDMIQEVQEMADDLEIPADFINPLMAMADQLRTNIIEHKLPSLRDELLSPYNQPMAEEFEELPY